MPKVAYSEQEREKIKEELITTAHNLFVEQGIQHTTVEQIYRQVGISRTFFYSFFPAKEDLMIQVFNRQQPLILQHAKSLMEDPHLSWRDGVKQFLYDCCYTNKGRFTIMTVEEQQTTFKRLSPEKHRALQEKLPRFFSDILRTFGIHSDEATTKLLANLVLSMVIVHKAIPYSLPFLFPEAADPMAEFQIDGLVNFMESLREQQNGALDT